MTMLEYMEKAMRKERLKTFSASDQLSLGDLIDQLKEIRSKSLDSGGCGVVFDFCGMFPTSLHSWRGIYAELALDPTNYSDNYETTPLSLDQFIHLLEEAVGKEYTGWKGGDFKMGRRTPLWVAASGSAGNTAVVDAVYDGCCYVVIMTGYREI